MTNDVSHLTKAAAEALNLSNEGRIEKIQSERWIGYPRANEIIEAMEKLLRHPKKHRMPNLLIVGDTNQGKSMIGSRFVSKHPGHDNPDGETITLPVLMIQSPPRPKERDFYDNILRSLYAPVKKTDPESEKRAEAIEIFKEINLGMLIIDEIHHLLAGPFNSQKVFLQSLKYLGNESKVPIVGLGTKDAVRAIHSDDQLSNRFKPMHLPRWKEGTEFKRLLVSFERMIPLRLPSELHTNDMARALYNMSEGYIGELAEIVETAAVEAVESGKEHIDLKILKGMNWASPSQRKKLAKQFV